MAVLENGEHYEMVTVAKMLETVRLGRFTTSDGVMRYPEGYVPGGEFDIREKDGQQVLYYKQPKAKAFKAVGVIP